MENKQKIIIGGKIITRKDLFKRKEKFRRVKALMPFEEKIKALVDLQKIAYVWGRRKDVIIWEG